jgi:hypothetical protein
VSDRVLRGRGSIHFFYRQSLTYLPAPVRGKSGRLATSSLVFLFGVKLNLWYLVNLGLVLQHVCAAVNLTIGHQDAGVFALAAIAIG